MVGRELFRTRWPRWMWANEEVVAFAGGLRGFNATKRGGPPVGFHGLDVYSLWDSLRAIMDYLREHEPDSVAAAQAAYRCFEPYHEDPQAYAFATRMLPESCADEVIELLAHLRPSTDAGSLPGLDPAFVARQNGAYGAGAKAVVWAHNTHIGDARATDMATAGMVNIGQLARERWGERVLAVGFGTHRGSVIGSGKWGGPVRHLPVPQARPDSIEALLHRATPDVDSLYAFPHGAEAGSVGGSGGLPPGGVWGLHPQKALEATRSALSADTRPLSRAPAHR